MMTLSYLTRKFIFPDRIRRPCMFNMDGTSFRRTLVPFEGWLFTLFCGQKIETKEEKKGDDVRARVWCETAANLPHCFSFPLILIAREKQACLGVVVYRYARGDVPVL